MSSVFLLDEFERMTEPGGSYQLDIAPTVLAAWVIGGLVPAVPTIHRARN